MFIVGIDVAKRFHEVTVITSEGEIVCKAFRISNNCTGYNRLTERLRKLTHLKSDFVFALESTAHYWLALYTRLKKDGFHVVVLNPIQTAAMRELCLKGNKTDSIDSLVIAEVIRFGRYSVSNVPQEDLLALKELCRSRSYFIDASSDFKRKTLALLDRVFPEFEAFFDSPFCKSGIAVLRKYPTPQKLSNANLAKLTDILSQASNGRFGEWKARELKAAARSSFGIEDPGGVYAALILSFLEEQQLLQAKADEMEKQIALCLQQFDTTILSIPGIGVLTAATILSELGDVSRFSSAEKLTAYIGLNPKVTQSGEFSAHRSHMSKRGSPYLRRAIWMASQIAVQYDPMFRTFFERKRAQGKSYMTAIGHVTKKMVAVIYAVLRDHKEYKPVLATD